MKVVLSFRGADSTGSLEAHGLQGGAESEDLSRDRPQGARHVPVQPVVSPAVLVPLPSEIS